MKRIKMLMLLLVFILLTNSAFLKAEAATIVQSGACGDNLTWTLDDEGTLTISGTGAMEDYAAYYAPWYTYRTSVLSAVIEAGVTSIGNRAFFGCSAMTSVVIPDSVISIGDSAFFYCDSLTEIVLPNSVTTIGTQVFSCCAALNSVTIPASVTSIGEDAFSSGKSLMGIWVDDENTVYSSDSSGVLFNKSKTELIRAPGGLAGSYTVIGTVTSIAYRAFYDCDDLVFVTIKGDLNSIGIDAFYECSALTTVVMNGHISSIGDFAFDCCSNLKNIIFSGNAPAFGGYVFHNVTATAYYPLDDVSWTDAVKQNYDGDITWISAYGGACGKNMIWTLDANGILTIDGDGEMTNVNLGNSPWYDYRTTIKEVCFRGDLINIGDYAFYRCNNLSSISVPNGIASIGTYAFAECSSLKDITIPESVTSIEFHAFKNTEWYNNQPDGIIYIGDFVYKYKGSCPECVVIPMGTMGIADYAFYECNNLKEISIPDSVTNIGYSAFSGCSSLQSMTIPFVGGSKKTNLDTYQYPFGYIFGSASYTGGAKTQQRYYGSSTSSTSFSTYYIPTSLQSVTVTGGNILYGAFYGCVNIVEILVPDSATGIGSSAFFNCRGLQSVNIPNSVQWIGDYAFYYCNKLTSVSISENVISIGAHAFDYCTTLNEIKFCGNAPSIGEKAFNKVTAAAYYYANDSWTASVMVDYGGTISWLPVELPKVWLCQLGVKKQGYSNLMAAFAEYDAEIQYLKLSEAIEESITLTQNLYIDLNGFDLTGIIDTNGYSVYIMDSTTDGYTCDSIGYFNCMDSHGNTVVPVGNFKTDKTGAIKRYMAIADENGYSFHRFYLGVTHASIKPGAGGVGYKAVFAGDEMVCAVIDAYGYSLRLEGFESVNAEKYGSPVSGKAFTLRLNNFDVENYSEAGLTAQVYITVNGEKISASAYTTTVKDMIQAVDATALQYTAAQLGALKAWLSEFSVPKTWNLTNI